MKRIYDNRTVIFSFPREGGMIKSITELISHCSNNHPLSAKTVRVLNGRFTCILCERDAEARRQEKKVKK